MPLYPAANPNFINLKDYCEIDGVTDDSVRFTSAYALAASRGMGLFHPGGTLIKGNDTLVSNVPIVGAGPGISIIKLKAGANTDLFSCQTSSINLSATFGASIIGNVSGYTFKDITLDGNKANQSSGPSWVIRSYSYAFKMENVNIWNGYSGGWQQDWNGYNTLAPNSLIDQYEPQIVNVKVHDCNGVGVQWSGPGAAQFTNFQIFNTGSHLLHLAPNAPVCKFSNFHAYGPGQGNNSVCILNEASSTQFHSVQCEGSDTVNFVVLANEVIFRGLTFGEGTSAYLTDTAIQIGQAAGNTPYPGQVYQAAGVTTQVLPTGCLIEASIYNTLGTNGAVWFSQDGGNNIVRAVIHLASGSYVTGTISNTTFAQIQGTGLTYDGSIAKGGTFQIPGNSNEGFVLVDTNGNQLVHCDKFGDMGINNSLRIAGSSSLYSGSGAPSNGTGINGDFYFRNDTPGTANQRIYVKSAGSWVGIV